MTFRKLSKCNKVIVTDIYAVVYKSRKGGNYDT
nr:MAG TPA: hypothetical protein [Caudoviricetes sp.]